MANKYIQDVEIEVRQKLPALQGLNVDAHMPKARSGSNGFIGQALNKMVADIADYNVKLNQAELDKDLRQTEVDFMNAKKELPPGWEGSDDGLKKYNEILQKKIDSKRELLESRRGGIGKDFYDEQQMRLSEGGAQDLYNAQMSINKYRLQEARQREAMYLGTMTEDMNGYFAVSADEKARNNIPPHRFSSDDSKAIDSIVTKRIDLILDNPSTTKEEKLKTLRSTILDSEDNQSKYWFNTMINTKHSDFVLRVNGVEQMDLVTGQPIMDQASINRVINETFDAQERNFTSGSYKNKLMKEYGLDAEQAEDVSKASYGRFKQQRISMQQQIDGRAAASSEKIKGREFEIASALSKAEEDGKTKMANTLKQNSNLAGVYSTIHGRPMDMSSMFIPLDGSGVTEFQKFFGVSAKEMLQENKFVADLYDDTDVALIMNANSVEEMGQNMCDTILKEVDDPAGRELALRSMAYRLQQEKSPLAYNALVELSKPNANEHNAEDRAVIASASSTAYKNLLKDNTPRTHNLNDTRRTEEGIKAALGGNEESYNLLIMHIANNVDSLAPEGSKFALTLKDATVEGVTKEWDFRLAVFSAYRQDPNFRRKVDDMMPSVMKMSSGSYGNPATLSRAERQKYIDMAGKNAAEAKASSLKTYGAMIPTTKRGASGSF